MLSELTSLFSDIASTIRKKGGVVTTVDKFPNSIRGIETNASNILYQMATRTMQTIQSPVSLIYSYTFANCKELSQCELPKCTTIEEGVFMNCINLNQLSIPNVEQIGNFAFSNCTNITEISFPKCIELSERTFINCTNLKTAYLPLVNECSGTFMGCTNLKKVDLQNATDCRETFHGCLNLEKVSLPNCSRIAGGAFYNCVNLTSLTLNCHIIDEPWFTSSFNGVFGNCYKLKEIDFKNLSSLLENRLFVNCYNLSKLYFRGSSMIDISLSTFDLSTMFINTPYTGYSLAFSGKPVIYVLPSLVDAYKTDSKWSVFASYFQPIEEETT